MTGRVAQNLDEGKVFVFRMSQVHVYLHIYGLRIVHEEYVPKPL